jgi:hypothetical protein
MSVVNLTNQQESLSKLIEIEFSNIDPIRDIQNYIGKNSSFIENDRLKKLYKEMGMFVALSDETSAL